MKGNNLIYGNQSLTSVVIYKIRNCDKMDIDKQRNRDLAEHLIKLEFENRKGEKSRDKDHSANKRKQRNNK
jgi:hypothetical protein